MLVIDGADKRDSNRSERGEETMTIRDIIAKWKNASQMQEN